METLLILLLLYNAWLVFYLLNEKRQGEEPAAADEPQAEKPPQATADIVGKSLFQMTAKEPTPATSLPQAATSDESEEVQEEDVTFADEAEKTPSARLPDDKLDEAFTDIRISDIPTEYGEDEPKTNAPIGYATGVTFEEIDEAVRTAKSPTASEDECHRAGKVFSEMEGTELFDKLIKGTSSIGSKITELMDCYFNQPIISRDGEKGNVAVRLQNIGGVVVPDSVEGFDIRNFV